MASVNIIKYHIAIGRKGERLAAQWLVKRGFVILHDHFRAGRFEIDIVADKNKTLCCIEVKTRTVATFGPPEHHISPRKKIQMRHAAEQLLSSYMDYDEARLFVLSVTLNNNGNEFFFEEVEQ